MKEVIKNKKIFSQRWWLLRGIFLIAGFVAMSVLFNSPNFALNSVVFGYGGGGGMSGELNLPAKISSLTPEAQIMDVNKDSKIDILDFNVLMVNWGASGTNAADFNGDSIVDIFDFNSLMIYWTI